MLDVGLLLRVLEAVADPVDTGVDVELLVLVAVLLPERVDDASGEVVEVTVPDPLLLLVPLEDCVGRRDAVLVPVELPVDDAVGSGEELVVVVAEPVSAAVAVDVELASTVPVEEAVAVAVDDTVVLLLAVEEPEARRLPELVIVEVAVTVAEVVLDAVPELDPDALELEDTVAEEEEVALPDTEDVREEEVVALLEAVALAVAVVVRSAVPDDELVGLAVPLVLDDDRGEPLPLCDAVFVEDSVPLAVLVAV